MVRGVERGGAGCGGAGGRRPAWPAARRRAPGRPPAAGRAWPSLHPPAPQVTKKVTSPLPTTDAIFYAGTGMLLCRSEEKVALFDVQQRR